MSVGTCSWTAAVKKSISIKVNMQDTKMPQHNKVDILFIFGKEIGYRYG